MQLVETNIYALPCLLFCSYICQYPFLFYLYRSMAEPKAKKITTRSYLTWSSEMDTALLSVLVEHHNNGDHAQNGWKPHVYHACIKHVKEKCNIDITKDNIVGRIKTFDKQYEIITKMLAQSGFGWDWEKNMVMVESDEVWDRYVEVLNTKFYFVLTFASSLSTLIFVCIV